MSILRLSAPAMLLIAALALHAQQPPAGWKVVKDKQGVCQIAVPADWVADKLVSSFVSSPDGKASAVAHGLRSGQSFAEATALAKQVMPPSKTIEDTAKRLWYAYQGPNTPAGGADWYVAVPGTPSCTATVTFKAAALEDTAKKIALSLATAK